VFLKGGAKEVIYFDKTLQLMNAGKNNYQKNMVKNLQLNNFCNSLNSGYLDKMKPGFFGKANWKQKFVVLSNVGLLYFKDPLGKPQDLFPVIDCEIVKIPLEQLNEKFAFKLVYSRKTLTFRCSSMSEFDAWFKAIRRL